MFPLKESVLISVNTSIDNVINTENANSFCTFFTNIAQNLKYETFKLRDFVWEKPPTPTTPTKDFNFSYVSRIFVERELKSLKRRKATGSDDLPTGILKDAAFSLSSPLTHLIYLSLSTGVVPNKWRIAKVTPIHKKGNTNDYNDYRPISVLSTCSKVLERAVHKQLKTKDIVESQLNEDLKNMSTYFKTNQLIINLNKDKTETMIFVTRSRLSKCDKKVKKVKE